MKKKPMVILTGPTAVGKTALSIELAKRIGGSVISADSMQVYKHMDIGSAKVMPDQMQGISHYLIDELEPDEEFHVVRFVQRAKAYLEHIYSENKIPIIAGGTGFYIQALLYDIDFTEQDCDADYRRELAALAEEKGPGYLHGLLRAVDSASADAIHENNVKRVIRALEFYHLSGKKISEHNETERKKTSPYNFAYFVLSDDRAHLYERIDKRVDLMLDQGLINEVSNLKKMGYHKDMVSMQGLGYKEILEYLDGKLTLEEAVHIIKRETRHFAKRQLTWFKREREVRWFYKPDYGYDDERILKDMIAVLSDSGIYNSTEESHYLEMRKNEQINDRTI